MIVDMLILTSIFSLYASVVLTIRKIEQEILAAGHHVCILTTKSGDSRNTHMDGEHPNRSVIFLDNSIPIPFLHDPNNPESSYQLGFALSKTVKQRIAEFEPSLIHITVPDCTCLHLIQYAREKEIPLMGTYHSNIPDYMSHYPGLGWLKHILAAFFRHQYNFLQTLYVPTPYIHKYLTETFQMDKVTKLGVWGRGIDLERFSPKHRSMEFRERMGFSEHDVVVMWCGRLVPEKRPDIFCKVVRRLHERKIPFKALVVGQGPVEEEVKNLPNMVFAGWMSGDELATAYASCDVFLFPSAVETFGNVTLEAAASGLPLVVEAGCSGHLVNHGINGFACQDNDVDAYFDGTLCLVVDDTRRKAMSEEGRKFSMNFDKREVCRKMLDNYSTVTDDFFFVHGGHHANRDRQYQNEHSFVGGNRPRPAFLILVEFLFVFLFLSMYHVASLFVCVKNLVVPSRNATQQAESTSAPAVTTADIPPTPRQLSLDAHLRCIEEVHVGHESDLETQDSRIKTVIVVPIKDDDDTASTTSLSDDSSSNARQSGAKSCCPTPQQPNISHALAIGFVKLLQLQFRIESQLRSLASDSLSSSHWTIMKRKRKNSSMGADLLYIDDDLPMGSDNMSENLGSHVSASREERHCMRSRSTNVLSPAIEV